jgi:hypothetical protein
LLGLAQEDFIPGKKMKLRNPNNKDFYAGLMFFIFGILFLLMARVYPMGSTRQMGPGYFPALLGGVLAFIGIALSAKALWLGGEAIKSLGLRPLILLAVAVLSFAGLVQPLGLVLSILILVVISSLGGRGFRFRETVGLFIVLAAISVGVFVYGFGLPLGVWPK